MIGDVQLSANPYKGLVPYDEEDAALFFGRETEQAVIRDNLITSRLTVLYGESGVGKSSVLRAGVLPLFAKMAAETVRETGRPEFVCALYSSWSGDPIVGLKTALDQAVARLGSIDQTVEGGGTLSEYCRRITQALDVTLVIILDQFDEYFLYHPNEREEPTLFAQLPRIVNDLQSRVNVLISIRDDSLSALDRFKGHIPGLFKNYLRIHPLGLVAAEAAIRKPLATLSPAAKIDDDLVKEVLKSVRTDRDLLGTQSIAGGAQNVREAREPAVETPFLQLVMTRIWETEALADSGQLGWVNRFFRRQAPFKSPVMVLRKTTLDSLGGAERVVQNHVEHTLLKKFKPSEQNISQRLFYYLVTPSQTKIAYSADDLAGYLPEYTRTEIEGVLKKLAEPDARILRYLPAAPGRPGERYEIFHDVLAKAILLWRVRSVRAGGVSLTTIVALILGLTTWNGWLAYLLISAWPEGNLAPMKIGIWEYPISVDARYLLIAAASGGIGAYVHVMQSLAMYLGNRQFDLHWIWWYILRPLTGSNVGLVFYLILRGIFIKSDTGADGLNPGSVAAACGLAGMFSKQLLDKLNSVVEVTFATDRPHERLDTLDRLRTVAIKHDRAGIDQ